jgi:2-ketocyclohexanecarboxyl-CoA hydrolase
MTAYEDILVSREGAVTTITINRPEVLNAFRGVTLTEMEQAFRAAGSDPETRVIVLTGAGERAFCAGGDINWEAEGAYDVPVEIHAFSLMYSLYEAMRETYKPIIARVNGYAIGGGNHLHYMCDFGIAAEHAVFGQNGPRVGSPAEGWVVSYLSRIVGHRRAREMWMTCRRYPARQCLEWGLVNAVVPYTELDDEVARFAADLIAGSPTVLMVHKASFDDEWRGIRTLRDYMAELNPEFWDSGEQQEGAQAFLEKRQPDWSKFSAVAKPNR